LIKDLKAGDPASVGPYRLLGRLGVGGMGEVYLGKSPGGRLVAIKQIRPELSEERGFRNRFASEISAAKNVSGIYTAAVVDADADAEPPWMATVYVAGPSLTDAVEESGPLPVKSVLALAAGLAEALQAIHRVGLVHRDLKPSNVLLATDGPRVIDFGISLALERSMMTTTGMVLGSPGFMSPEQARGQREVGAPTDMFSLGAVLAFAATGESPFGRGPATALLYRVVNEPPDLATVPASLKPLIEQCLSKDPADRPTPAEVLASIGDVDVLTGEWLPQPIAATMVRYMPTLQTPVPPGLRETKQPAGPVAAASVAAAPAASAEPPSAAPPADQAGPASDDSAPAAAGRGYEPTALAPVVPGAVPAETALSQWAGPGPASTAPASTASATTGPADPAGFAATRAESSLLPETALVPAPGALTIGRDVPGGTGGLPPTGPPSPFRRWRWPLTAAAAAIIVIAVLAALLTSHSGGGTPQRTVTPTTSLAGTARATTTPASTTSPTATRQPTPPPPSQPAATTPATQAPTTAASTASASATATSASTATTPVTTTSPTTASTATATATTAGTPTQASTSSAATAPAQSPTP